MNAGNTTWYRVTYNGHTGYVYSGLVSTSAPAVNNASSGDAQTNTCPSNCTEARAMGLTPEQAAACGLDADGDGQACYSD